MIFNGGKTGGNADEAATARLKDSIDVVARRIAWGKHLNAGQTCVAPDHVLVDQRLHDPLVEALGRAFKSFEGGEYGRMVALQGDHCGSASLDDVAGRTRNVPLDDPLLRAVRGIGVSLGDA